VHVSALADAPVLYASFDRDLGKLGEASVVVDPL
jgi:hypothetical protein